jgi:predicted Zn-ribbon and HTH transcriptional regulator
MEKKKRKRRTKQEMELVRSSDEINISQGLGDTIEKITEATGIKALVKFIAGDDCGCDERKEKLNKLFPYKKPLCLQEDEYNYLVEFFSQNKTRLRPTEQQTLLKIYNRIFNERNEPSTCTTCWVDYLNKLSKIMNEYK